MKQCNTYLYVRSGTCGGNDIEHVYVRQCMSGDSASQYHTALYARPTY